MKLDDMMSLIMKLTAMVYVSKELYYFIDGLLLI